MEYTFITIVAIVTATLLVHQIANRLLRIRLHMKPLVLCAFCSLFLSLIIPRVIVSFTGIMGTIAVLAIFAIIFAFFIAYYEDQYTNDEDNNKANSEEFMGGVLAQEYIRSETYAKASPDIACTLRECSVNLSQDDLQAQAAETDPGEAELFSFDTAYDALNYEWSEPICEAAPEGVAEQADNDALPASANCDVQQLDAIQKDQELDNVEEKTELEGIQPMKEEILNYPSLQTTAIPDAQDLDELLDYAFLQKEKGNMTQALAAFRQILALFPSSSAAPFVVIEIGNILKMRGSYDEAIQVFAEAKSLPALQSDQQFEQEFVSTIAYLRIIKNVLVHRRLGLLPYDKIPADAFQEIDAEFREWRNLA